MLPVGRSMYHKFIIEEELKGCSHPSHDGTFRPKMLPQDYGAIPLFAHPTKVIFSKHTHLWHHQFGWTGPRRGRRCAGGGNGRTRDQAFGRSGSLALAAQPETPSTFPPIFSSTALPLGTDHPTKSASSTPSASSVALLRFCGLQDSLYKNAPLLRPVVLE